MTSCWHFCLLFRYFSFRQHRPTMTTAAPIRAKVGSLRQLSGYSNSNSFWKRDLATLSRFIHTEVVTWENGNLNLNKKPPTSFTRVSCNGIERRFEYKLFYTKSSLSSIQQCSMGRMNRMFSTGKEKEEKVPQESSGDPGPTGTIDNVRSSNSDALMDILPESIKPYGQLARVDKPIGTMLLLWPCLWSTALASSPTVLDPFIASPIIGDPKLIALFTTGSFLMRGAGCTINDMWDAKFDKSVARTATRPLASGALSYSQATAFLGCQLTGGLMVLLNLPHLEYCFWLGAGSLPFVVAYPLMKRYTNWPQLFLGMTFNWGALMGWAATHGELDWSALKVVLPLYVGGIAWTIVYDTLYAHQDKEDDAKLGLKSTALHFGQQTKPILYSFATLASGSWALSGFNVGYTEPYFFLGCGLAGAHLIRQIATANLEDSKNLADRFKSNNQVGGILFVSCVAGNLMAGA